MDQREPSGAPDARTEENTAPVTVEDGADVRPAWQRTKESWYDKVTLSVRQLDFIIAAAVVALLAVAVLIARDAGVF